MIDEFARLFELTIRELKQTARNIERQSWLVMRTRLRVRKYLRRWRRLRSRLRKRRKQREAPPEPAGPPCDFQPQRYRGGRVVWRCTQCTAARLQPMSPREQAEAGHSCPAMAEPTPAWLGR